MIDSKVTHKSSTTHVEKNTMGIKNGGYNGHTKCSLTSLNGCLYSLFTYSKPSFMLILFGVDI